MFCHIVEIVLKKQLEKWYLILIWLTGRYLTLWLPEFGSDFQLSTVPNQICNFFADELIDTAHKKPENL